MCIAENCCQAFTLFQNIVSGEYDLGSVFRDRVYYSPPDLTHWCRVTHIYVRKLTIIASDNGLAPGRRQAIIWSNAVILSFRTTDVESSWTSGSRDRLHHRVEWFSFIAIWNIFLWYCRRSWSSKGPYFKYLEFEISVQCLQVSSGDIDVVVSQHFSTISTLENVK